MGVMRVPKIPIPILWSVVVGWRHIFSVFVDVWVVVPRVGDLVRVLLELVLLHGEHVRVASSSQEPSLTIEIWSDFAFPHRRCRDGRAVTF